MTAMTNTNIYQNITARTGGDIYLGVVGPVRTGKSTFIKRFMDLFVLPYITDENTKKRHLWPGLNTVEVKSSDRPSEIVNQIEVSRQILKNDPGVVHWSIAGISKNYAMAEALKNGPYKEAAIPPTTTWIKGLPMLKPILEYTNSGTSVVLNWTNSNANNVFHWVIYLKYGDEWETQIFTKEETHKTVNKSKNGKTLNAIAIKGVDRLGYESDYDAKKVK